MSKMTSRDHIPAPGLSAGLQGMALCGRWARYQTGDHALIRRLAAGVAAADDDAGRARRGVGR